MELNDHFLLYQAKDIIQIIDIWSEQYIDK